MHARMPRNVKLSWGDLQQVPPAWMHPLARQQDGLVRRSWVLANSLQPLDHCCPLLSAISMVLLCSRWHAGSYSKSLATCYAHSGSAAGAGISSGCQAQHYKGGPALEELGERGTIFWLAALLTLAAWNSLQIEQRGQGQTAAAAARQMHQQGEPDLVPGGSSAPSDEAAAAAEAEVDPFGDFLEGLEGASGDLESQLAKLEQEEEVTSDPADALHLQRPRDSNSRPGVRPAGLPLFCDVKGLT